MKHWPIYTTPNEKPYALKHVRILEHAIAKCESFRTAIQAGGSIGYWPMRMARDFARVITFEPEPLIFECLEKNMAGYENVEVRNQALGWLKQRCSIERRSFGSHYIIPGDTIDMVRIDDLGITDLDLLQLDIEGYEPEALNGGKETIDRCRPVIMVEILDPENTIIRSLLTGLGYREVQKIGRDYVFLSE